VDERIGTEFRVSNMLAIPDGEPLNILGYIDQWLVVDSNGEGIIRDWKSGYFDPGPNQLAMYAWMVRESLGITVERGQLVKLKLKDIDKCVVDYDLSKLVDLVPQQLLGLVEQLKHDTIFPVKPSNFCGSCTVKASCAFGSQLPDGDEVG